MTRSLCTSVLAAVLLTTAVAQRRAAAPSANLPRAAARAQYAAAGWPRSTARTGCALGEFTVAGLTGQALELVPPGLVCRRYADAAGEPRVLVELLVADSVALAQDQLLDWLAARTCPTPAPGAASLGAAVGDVGFVGVSGAGQGRLEWVVLVRGNLAARIVCLDPRATPHPDLVRIAQALDAVFEAAPALAPAAVPPRPAIHKLAAERDRCRAGQVLRLELQCRDPREAAPMVLWEVGGVGQGQGYVEADRAGIWQLHTTGAGSMTLTARVLGSTGTVASASVTLRIE